jgi:hypothetical protein
MSDSRARIFWASIMQPPQCSARRYLPSEPSSRSGYSLGGGGVGGRGGGGKAGTVVFQTPQDGERRKLPFQGCLPQASGPSRGASLSRGAPAKGVLDRGPLATAHRLELPRQLHHPDVVAVRGYAVVVARLGDEHAVRGGERAAAGLRDERAQAVDEQRQAAAGLPVRHGDAEGGDWHERRAGRGVERPGVHDVNGLGVGVG